MKKILFISGSLGLGHVGRDLEIAKMLRKSSPGIQISWLADNPATNVLKQAGEKLLPETEMLTHGNKELDSHAKNHQANLTRWVMRMRKDWSKNAKIVTEIIRRENFDLVIGETGRGLDENDMLFAGTFIKCRDIQDTVGIDIEGNLDMGNAAW